MQNIILQRALKAPGLCFGIHVGKKQSLKARTTCVLVAGGLQGKMKMPTLGGKGNRPVREGPE